MITAKQAAKLTVKAGILGSGKAVKNINQLNRLIENRAKYSNTGLDTFVDPRFFKKAVSILRKKGFKVDDTLGMISLITVTWIEEYDKA
jgi:hypothetical protein